MTTYLEDIVTNIDVMRDPVLVGWGCGDLIQCNVHIEGTIALPLHQYLLRSGSLVTVFVHNDVNPDDDDREGWDANSLMQSEVMPRPSRAPSIVPVRLVGLHRTSALILMDSTEQFSTELEAHWPFHRRSHADIESVHEVMDPPTFAGQAQTSLYLIEFRDDRFSQTHTDDVMGLVTIIFDGSEDKGPRRERLRAQWIPHKATRENMMDFLRATWICRRPDVLCSLYHNGKHWPFQDQTLRTMDYGDHVRLQIRSSGPGWCDLEFSESVERQRKIYESSSEIEEIEADRQPEGADAGATPSMVRSGGA